MVKIDERTTTWLSERPLMNININRDSTRDFSQIFWQV